MATAGRSKGLSNVLKLPENLSELLAFDPDTLAVTGREGKRREFKLDYFQKDMSDYTKPLAAVANADAASSSASGTDRARLSALKKLSTRRNGPIRMVRRKRWPATIMVHRRRGRLAGERNVGF